MYNITSTFWILFLLFTVSNTQLDSSIFLQQSFNSNSILSIDKIKSVLDKNANAIGAIADTIQAFGVIASLIFVGFQLKESTKATKAATYQSAISNLAGLETRISQDADTAEIYIKGCENYQFLNSSEKTRFMYLMCSFFGMYKNLYYQYEKKLLEKEMWEGWYRNMQGQLRDKGIQIIWANTRILYSEKFRKYVDDCLQAMMKKNPDSVDVSVQKFLKVEAVLTPQQQQQFQTALAQGQGMGSALANLNLSQEQQSQLQDIMQSEKAQKQQLLNQG